jgi:hypothetical protein
MEGRRRKRRDMKGRSYMGRGSDRDISIRMAVLVTPQHG